MYLIEAVSREQANEIWDILLSYGAQEKNRDSFVAYFVAESDLHEYRFCGVFGGGGKIRLGTIENPYFVTYYSESETKEREELLQRVNSELKNLAIKHGTYRERTQ
jgi:hypothetical protein